MTRRVLAVLADVFAAVLVALLFAIPFSEAFRLWKA
jgi:hypothetical protein